MKKSDVAIEIVPGDEATRFFVKDRKLPVFEVECGSENVMHGTFGDITLPELTYDQMICMIALFETVADWIKPETPKKAKKVEGLEITRIGWMAPGGIYFPVKQLLTHHTLAEDIWEKYYYDTPRSTETWATAQTDLMRLGWLRVDYGDVMFMRRPTILQKETLEQMLEWKLKNPKEWTSLDLGAFEKMQRICMWLSEDAISVAVSDFADLEDEIERV